MKLQMYKSEGKAVHDSSLHHNEYKQQQPWIVKKLVKIGHMYSFHHLILSMIILYYFFNWHVLFLLLLMLFLVVLHHNEYKHKVMLIFPKN